MKNRKPEDDKAAEIEFGIELETAVPQTSGITVGHYHAGSTVSCGRRSGDAGAPLVQAPTFHRAYWRSERDGSIQYETGFQPSEFVSPRLKGAAGVECVREFVKFALAIGARVNRSCGCHITVGIRSLIGTNDPDHVARYLRKLIRISQRHLWAIYAQTGSDRHKNSFSVPIPDEAGDLTNAMIRAGQTAPERAQQAKLCKRGAVNLQKAFREDGCIEFRAFAGTLNEQKILHHLATVFGLCRRAATTQMIPPFKVAGRRDPDNAPAALGAMWEYLGWLEDAPGADVAFGQFAALHTEFPRYAIVAMEKAKKFQEKFPDAMSGPATVQQDAIY